ncbi:MAG: NADH-quinone oxidoreductase subunit N [Gammaproteobacteria bacterium]|nr:NADH-quinone oxidoreductase subunit N [Gammaproteobacteria bacterium]
MTPLSLQALMPSMVLTAAIVVTMLAIAARRHHTLTAVLAGLGLVGVLLTLPLASRVTPRAVTALLLVDDYALFFGGLVATAALTVVAASYSYLHRWQGRREEWYLLIMTATLGALVLACARHLAAVLVGLELLSVSLFALIGYARLQARPLEAALKYLILAGVSSAFLLLGMALVYARLGVLDFDALARSSAVTPGLLLPAGCVLILVGLAFKLSLVPFHLWAPDVFEGAPAPVGGLLATVSKGAIVALALRYFEQGGGHQLQPLPTTLALLAMASMLAGNLLALYQNDLKRVLACSSIAHFGYLLVALLAAGELAVESVGFYLMAYFVSTLAAFGVVTVVGMEATARPDATSPGALEEGRLAHYRGLLWRRPLLAVVLLLALLSLAGLPITAGFVAKLYVVAAGAASHAWALLTALVVGSVIGLFYYLRIAIVVADLEHITAPAPPGWHWSQLPARLSLALLGLSIPVIGILPGLGIVASRAALPLGQ